MKYLKCCIMSLLLIISRIHAQADLPERLFHYRPGDWTSYQVSRYVSSLTLGNEFVYFGTTGGIWRYQFFEHTWYRPFTESDGMASSNVQDVLYDFDTGFLWCVTDAGISFHEPATEYWRNISGTRFGDILDFGLGREYVWVKTRTGYFRIDAITGFIWASTTTPGSADQIRWSEKMEAGIDQQYFVDADYLIVQDGIQDAHLRVYSFTDAVQDQFNNRWLGTWGLGTAHAKTNMLDLNFHQIGPYAPDIRAMAWDEDGMWMGGFPDSETPHGITYWNMNEDTWHYHEAIYLPGLRSDAVTAIVVNGPDIWLGTSYGLAKYNTETGEWRTFSPQHNLWDREITSLAMNDSVLWAGTIYGINRIKLDGHIIEKVRDKQLVHLHIFQLEVDEEGVWAGTDRGIFRYRANEKEWRFKKGYGGMLTHDITAVAAYGNEVWFGTDDGIEMINKRTGEWTGYPTAHFTTGDYIYTILPDDQAVWFGTDQGLLKYIRDEDRWRLFTVDDGLPDNVIQWILLDGDDLWLGTPRGLTRFYWNAPYRVD